MCVGHVYTYLVSTTGLQLDVQQTMPPVTTVNPVMSHGRFAPFTDRLPFTIDRMSSDGRVYGATGCYHAADYRIIFAQKQTGLQLFYQRGVCRQGPCDNQQTGSHLVDSMHDPAARQAFKRGIEIQQGILHRAIRVPGCRVYHQPGRFVHDNDRIVLINNIKRNILGIATGLRRQGPENLYPLAATHLVPDRTGCAVDSNLAGLDPGLQATARVFREQCGEGLVQALASLCIRYFSAELSDIDHLFTAPDWVILPLLFTCLPITIPRDKFVGSVRPPLIQIFTTIALLIVLLPGCSLLPDQPDETKGWSANQLYSRAHDAMNSGDYEKAVRYFEILESRYPFGRHAQQAQIDMAYSYYKQEEPESAISTLDRFIRTYPRHPNIDYAFYLKGLVNFNRGDNLVDRFLPRLHADRDPGSTKQAFRDFSELVKRFPDSRYAEDASQRMLYLRNSAAMHEIHVANFYVRRGALLAAANRAEYVIENYQGTPAVREALTILEKVYRELGMDTLHKDILRVIALNYPDHPALAQRK